MDGFSDFLRAILPIALIISVVVLRTKKLVQQTGRQDPARTTMPSAPRNIHRPSQAGQTAREWGGRRFVRSTPEDTAEASASEDPPFSEEGGSFEWQKAASGPARSEAIPERREAEKLGVKGPVSNETPVLTPMLSLAQRDIVRAALMKEVLGKPVSMNGESPD